MSKKVKYYYDTETLAYKKIKPKRGRNFGYIALFIFSSALFGFLCFVILLNTPFFETPKDKIQAREIENLKIRYDILEKRMVLAQDVLVNIEERDNNLYRVFFNSSPIPMEQRRAGLGGINRYDEFDGYNNSDLIKNATRKMDILSKSLVVQSKSLDEIINLAKDKEKLLAAIPAIQPVKNEDLTRMASGFGYRNDPFTKIRKFHYGMDFTAKTGTPIFATGDGVVMKADNSMSGYGNLIIVNHGFGYKSFYAHMSKFKARKGQKVKRGDIIGYVGSTGRSEAPHLHYEVHKDGQPINPINFYYGSISAEEYKAISELANQENQALD
jgi:murein DD-endopeptidase MepM/ murein hydrolase activator NlpD